MQTKDYCFFYCILLFEFERLLITLFHSNDDHAKLKIEHRKTGIRRSMDCKTLKNKTFKLLNQ